MRLWRSLRDLIARNKPGAPDWDKWWKNRLLGGAYDMFPCFPVPILMYEGERYDIANRDGLLVAIMAEYGLRTVLCAGSGISQEPRALAAAGCDVTALDISPTALRVAQDFELGQVDDLGRRPKPAVDGTGGLVDQERFDEAATKGLREQHGPG